MQRCSVRRALAALAAALVAGCGGGGGGDSNASSPVVVTPPAVGGALNDNTAYSSAANASLAASSELAATSTHTVSLSGGNVAYTARAGHLDARDPLTGATKASMFYVDYTVAGAAAARPVVFFFNGGPGSATIWLHLGSFAPRRVVTHAPATSVPLPFALVDNAESLIDVADLVFVDAVGTGYSEAVAPNTNQTFWGVDADAAVMRDFIARYVAVNQRAASPTFIFGESYGTTRAAVLADLMLAANLRLDGVIVLSSALDYNSNCDVFAPGDVSCEGFVPSYGETGAWHGRVQPAQADADAYADVLRSFATSPYGPAAAAFVATGQPGAPALIDQLVALTGAPATAWNANLDLDPLTFRQVLVPGQLLGRYDARIAAPTGSALAAGGDPSSTLIGAPFTAAARQLFEQELGYVASAGYVTLSNAISSWDFRHDGRALPDTVVDLGAALTRKPALRVLSLAGYHDVATPFRQTELDIARLGAQPTLFTRVYPGGHMTYLDDTSRPRLKADVAAFVQGKPMALHADGSTQLAAGSPKRVRSQVEGGGATASAAETRARVAAASRPAPLDRSALAQGGDPWLPPALRVRSSTTSPRGAALAARVQAKIAERDRDVYR